MYSQEGFYGKTHSVSVLLMKTVSKLLFGNKRSLILNPRVSQKSVFGTPLATVLAKIYQIGKTL